MIAKKDSRFKASQSTAKPKCYNTGMEKVIEVLNLKKTYRLAKGKTLEALKGISFAVEKGEIFGILGPNGAGKTTTLEIIEGLKNQTSGTVFVLGFDNLKNIGEIKKRIGIQLQSSQYLHHLSLGELLDLFASLYGHTSEREKLLDLVGLKDKINEEVKNLSGGQKQRFTIATSLVHSPEILFLDEPTTGLDPAARRSMWQLIKKLNIQGITIILTTHYMEEAEFLCHRVAIMDSGKVLEIDEPRKLIDKISDTTQVSFLTDGEVPASLFSNLSQIKKIYSSYPKTTIEILSVDDVASILSVLRNNKIAFSGFTLKTASLEDVYLKLTGKEYEQ
jgi:ABC-2 type transport system ATP-binding protein